MNILIIDTYYSEFLESLNEKNAACASKSYEEQWRVLMNQCFGVADFYSKNLKKIGHEAKEVIANYEPLQRQWAKENGIKLAETKNRWTMRMRRGIIPWPYRIQPNRWIYDILASQVKQYLPDVLYIQDMNYISADFLIEMRNYVRLIVGQIASPKARDADFSGYDLVLSSFPHFVKQFRHDGLKSEYFNLAFEPKVLIQLKKQGRQYQTVFVGGLSAAHVDRIQLLEKISTSQTLDIWGYGKNLLDPKSPVRALHHGNAWGIDMYNILYNSKIALNNHIRVAENYANNMRLFEATGVGTLLITDHKDNLHTLFEPGKEVVAYTSAEECIELIKYYLENEEERKCIARSGQRRTLCEYTYYERMRELIDIIHKYI